MQAGRRRRAKAASVDTLSSPSHELKQCVVYKVQTSERSGTVGPAGRVIMVVDGGRVGSQEAVFGFFDALQRVFGLFRR